MADVAGSKIGIELTHGFGKIINTVPPVQLMGRHTQWCFYVPWRQQTECCYNLGSSSMMAADKHLPSLCHSLSTVKYVNVHLLENDMKPPRQEQLKNTGC